MHKLLLFEPTVLVSPFFFSAYKNEQSQKLLNNKLKQQNENTTAEISLKKKKFILFLQGFNVVQFRILLSHGSNQCRLIPVSVI